MDYVKEFETIWATHVKREGADKLIEYIRSTDFFTAPASSRFHSNFQGGLVEHSVKVYNRFVKLVEMEGIDIEPESIAIIALLHDICKVNYYKIEMRNVKVDGSWVQKPYYAVEDTLPYGHGEKSVYMISAFMRLTREEAMAINWHMGAFDPRAREGNLLNKAYAQHPLTLLFHIADITATYLDERTV